MTQRGTPKGSLQKIQKHYEGVEYAKEWEAADEFCYWVVDQKGWSEGWQLDKDLIGNGKFYGPEHCVFLPRELNYLISAKSASSAKQLASGMWSVKTRLLGQMKIIHGESKEEVEQTAKKYRQKLIQVLASQCKDKLDPRAYTALVNFDR